MRCTDLRENVYGRLTVISAHGKNKRGSTTWLCLCECGNEVVVLGSSLTGGNTKSCGCLQRDRITEVSKTHGMCATQQYRAWATARERVLNPKQARYKDYGGRGIKMCQEWEDSFEVFWLDMGPTWKEGLTLDRIDVNGNYCKENCRWASRSIQSHNRRKWSGCSSRFIGVNINQETGKCSASIQINRKQKRLGYFATEVEAAISYDNASEELYGDRPNGTQREGG